MDKIVFTPQEQSQLRNLGGELVVLFGSRASGLSRDGSDYDIGVLARGDEKGLYEALYDILEPKTKNFVTVDIVFLDKAPLELSMHVVRYGNILFESKPGVFANFKERIIDRYADFAPIRQMFHEEILGRIPA